ncbi:MAG: hypothetical protein CFE26_04815 [Verrucomicrobiales bacterium VVV1]|nr:MAG: hypothetical protein CFE26_04815 [Verrucomicrobiales bacterium VVV1]
MKNKLRFLTAALLCFGSAEAVTLSLNTATDITRVGASTNTSNPSSQVVANGTVTASASALVLSNPGGLGNFQLVDAASPAVFGSAVINRPNGGGGPVSGVSAETTYQVAFVLGLSEQADVSFDLNYDLIENKSLNGLITWSLVGPGSTNIFTPGTIGVAGTTDNLVAQSITQQTARITAAGTYTFTLKGIANQGGTTTVGPNSGVTVNFNSINFTVTSVAPVPEPSTTLLGLAGLGLVLGRRRRH